MSNGTRYRLPDNRECVEVARDKDRGLVRVVIVGETWPFPRWVPATQLQLVEGRARRVGGAGFEDARW